jgi:hypothetical protein
MAKLMAVVETGEDDTEAEARDKFDNYREAAYHAAQEWGVTLYSATCADVSDSGVVEWFDGDVIPTTFVPAWETPDDAADVYEISPSTSDRWDGGGWEVWKKDEYGNVDVLAVVQTRTIAEAMRDVIQGNR